MPSAKISFTELSCRYLRTELRDNGVGIIWMDRPPANAYDLDMLLEFDEVAVAIRFDERVKAVILASASEKFFSAGADISVIRDMPPAKTALLGQTGKEFIMRIRSIPKIFIAAIDGHCLGGGLELALACDLRFAGEGKWSLGLPEVKLGAIPGEGGTQLLGRTVGFARALQLLVEGSILTPQEAKEAGIVDRLFPAGSVMDEAIAFAEKLASGPGLAIGYGKLALTEGLEVPLHAAFFIEWRLQTEVLLSKDIQEGAHAFLEKRTPHFTGE